GGGGGGGGGGGAPAGAPPPRGPPPAVRGKAASGTGRPRPTAPTMAATTAATASSPNASVAVTTSATPSSAAKTSHTIHDPMVTPGAGAAGEKPTYRANVRGSPTSLYLTVTPPWRADAMTGEPAHPLAKGLRQASLSETVTVPRCNNGTMPSTEPRRGRSCRHSAHGRAGPGYGTSASVPVREHTQLGRS